MMASELALEVVTIIPRGENVWQISTVAVATLICSSWINFTAVTWLYTAEDSSHMQKGCSCSCTAFPSPAPWRSWRTAPAAEKKPACTAHREEMLNQHILSCPVPVPPRSAHFSHIISWLPFPSRWLFCYQGLCWLYCQLAEMPDRALRIVAAGRISANMWGAYTIMNDIGKKAEYCSTVHVSQSTRNGQRLEHRILAKVKALAILWDHLSHETVITFKVV